MCHKVDLIKLNGLVRDANESNFTVHFHTNSSKNQKKKTLNHSKMLPETNHEKSIESNSLFTQLKLIFEHMAHAKHTNNSIQYHAIHSIRNLIIALVCFSYTETDSHSNEYHFIENNKINDVYFIVIILNILNF